MKFEADYTLKRGAGQDEEKGKAVIALSEETLTLSPAGSGPFMLPWEHIFNLSFHDYNAKLGLREGFTLIIASLGYKFEDFARHAAGLRNERLIALALAEEPLKKSMIEAELDYSRPAGEHFKENCELRIYETSLIALPETRDFVRLPLRWIKEIKERDYVFEIISETGETWRLSGMGQKFDHFRDSLRAQISALELFVQKALAAALAGSDPFAIRAVSKILREGKLVALDELERTMPGFIQKLEKRIYSNDTDAQEYSFLKKTANSATAAFGIKKGLMGALSGDHYMFVFGFNKPVPVASVESFLLDPKSGPGSTDKKATYFYRMPKAGDSWREFITFFNKAMTAVNFRRMPILLSDTRLLDPRYAIYAGAVERVPELKVLRGLYIGRAIHNEYKQWTADISAITEFASRNPSPGDRWRKSGADEEDAEADSVPAADSSPAAKED